MKKALFVFSLLVAPAVVLTTEVSVGEVTRAISELQTKGVSKAEILAYVNQALVDGRITQQEADALLATIA